MAVVILSESIFVFFSSLDASEIKIIWKLEVKNDTSLYFMFSGGKREKSI
jgi:hypothetical protein